MIDNSGAGRATHLDKKSNAGRTNARGSSDVIVVDDRGRRNAKAVNVRAVMPEEAAVTHLSKKSYAAKANV
jgi:hypothetical protein